MLHKFDAVKFTWSLFSEVFMLDLSTQLKFLIGNGSKLCYDYFTLKFWLTGKGLEQNEDDYST